MSISGCGNAFTICTVSRLRLMSLPIRRDVVWGVGAVGVVDDGSGGVGFDAVLVDDSFEGGAAAEAVGEGGGGDAICVGPRECDRGGRCEAEYVVTVGDVVEGVGE